MKARRQKKILEAILEKKIATQEQLALELQAAGFRVTQATISRDIRELGLVKAFGENKMGYYTRPDQSVPVQNDERLKRLFKNSVIFMDYSENLVVVKTHPGEAQGVASALDIAGWKEVIGTVAGDDTVLLVIKPKNKTPLVMDKLVALARR